MRIRQGCFGLLVLVACGPVVGDAADTDDAETDPTGEGVSTNSTSVGTSVATSVGTSVGTSLDTSTGETTTDPTNETASILETGKDTEGPIFECDQWAQDCAAGEKCMPWANDGGSNWNATRCSPVDPNPSNVGESCVVEGSAVSGLDNCVLGAMCFNVDPDTGEGECIAFCQGNEAEPSCADGCSSCSLTGEGVLILCIPGCDPIAQDCSEGQGCYPLGTGEFGCLADASDEAGNSGGIGEPCEFINVCNPGTFCALAELVPGCEATGCCAPFCNADAVDGCDALLPGTACVPWQEDPEPPDGCTTATVGVCVAP